MCWKDRRPKQAQARVKKRGSHQGDFWSLRPEDAGKKFSDAWKKYTYEANYNSTRMEAKGYAFKTESNDCKWGLWEAEENSTCYVAPDSFHRAAAWVQSFSPD
jgi:hypothetical protein